MPSGSYIFQTPYQAFISPVIEGSLLSPIQRRLTERVRAGKNVSRTDNADEKYTLSVSDDGIADEIGNYYDASIPIDDLNATRDVELIPFYEMNDWNGDFLEYLKGTMGRGVQIWGDYPEYYPVHVDVDSLNAQEYLGNQTQSVLTDIREALNRWNSMRGLNLFTYSNVDRDNRQVIIDYREDHMPEFRPEYIRDEDGRYRIESGVVYLPSDIPYDYSPHEFGHGLGWVFHPNNSESIMRPSAYPPYITEIPDDDAYVVKTMTLLKNNTYWHNYIE